MVEKTELRTSFETETVVIGDRSFNTLKPEVYTGEESYAKDSPSLMATFLKAPLNEKLAIIHREMLPSAGTIGAVAAANGETFLTEAQLDMAVIESYLKSEDRKSYLKGYVAGMDKYAGMTPEERLKAAKKLEKDAIYQARGEITQKKRRTIWDYEGEIGVVTDTWGARVLFYGGMSDPKVVEVSFPMTEQDEGNPQKFESFKLSSLESETGQISSSTVDGPSTEKVIIVGADGTSYDPKSNNPSDQARFIHFFLNLPTDRKIEVATIVFEDKFNWDHMKAYPHKLDEEVIVDARHIMHTKYQKGLVDGRKDRFKYKKPKRK